MKFMIDIDLTQPEDYEQVRKEIVLPYLRQMRFSVWGRELFLDHPNHEEEKAINTISIPIIDIAKLAIEFDKEQEGLLPEDLPDDDTLLEFIKAAEMIKAYLKEKE